MIKRKLSLWQARDSMTLLWCVGSCAFSFFNGFVALADNPYEPVQDHLQGIGCHGCQPGACQYSPGCQIQLQKQQQAAEEKRLQELQQQKEQAEAKRQEERRQIKLRRQERMRIKKELAALQEQIISLFEQELTVTLNQSEAQHFSKIIRTGRITLPHLIQKIDDSKKQIDKSQKLLTIFKTVGDSSEYQWKCKAVCGQLSHFHLVRHARLVIGFGADAKEAFEDLKAGCEKPEVLLQIQGYDAKPWLELSEGDVCASVIKNHSEE